MKVVMTLLCRNEEDIIAENILFHLAHGIDHLVITDNGSEDATVERIAAFLDTGRITLLHEDRYDHDQATWVSRMAEIAVKHYHADWLIHADADEFWMPVKHSYHDIFNSVQSGVSTLSVKRYNYLPPDIEQENTPFYETQQIREVSSCNNLGQPLPPKICHRSADSIWVDDGNHAVYLEGEVTPARDCRDIEILHFPVRSLSQYTRKIRHGAEALARNSRISHGVGGTWRAHYEALLQKGSLEHEYRSMVHNETAIEKGIQDGHFKRDLRLASFFAMSGKRAVK